MTISTVLILAGCPHATVTLYRCIHLQEQLAQLGIDAVVQEWNDQPLAEHTVHQADLLVLQRVAMSANLRCLIDQFHAQRKVVIFDSDDLVFEPTLIHWHRGVTQLPPAEQQLYVEGVQRTLATLEASDYAFTASPLLADLAQRRGKPAFVHRNAVGHEMQALANRLYEQHEARGKELQSKIQNPKSKMVIGYGSGTPTHDVDFEEAVPALLDILTRHSQVELWVIGPLTLPPALALVGDRIRRYPLMDWRRYLELASQFDINLAPLEMNNLFCRAKSEIKFVEAALLAIPTIASRSVPFEHAINHGQDGLLAGNSAEWIDALETLVTDPDLRHSLGAAARRKVEQQYSLSARTADLAQVLHTVEQETRRQGDKETRRPGARRQRSENTELQSAIRNPQSAIPLVLNWLITEPFPGSGGHLGILRMIRHLVEFGHECHVYVAPMEQMYTFSAEQIRRFVDQHFMPTGAHFHLWNGRVYDADATIATYWETAYQLIELPNPGRCYYLVQDFEPFFFPMGTYYLRTEQTYRLGLHCITLGPWLARLMRGHYHATADHFDFAVDVDIYQPQPHPRADHPRVAFYARPSTPRRAYEIGIEALQLVKQKVPGVEIILYGANQLEPPPPFPYTPLGIRNPYELATLYSTCDVGLVLSLTNPSFVPFEMMACKCAVVDIRSERVEGLLEHRQTAMLADPTPASIAAAVLELLWDKPLHDQIVERAYAQVRQKTWRDSARQIEQVLLQHAPPPEQRRLSQRVHSGAADALLWQIHQLLDAEQATATTVDQLQAALHRTLAEKAQVAEQLRRTEERLHATQTRRTAAENIFRPLRNQAIEATPAWVLGNVQVGKLLINLEPIRQTFQGEQSNLTSLELLFASAPPATGHTIHFALYEWDASGKPLVERLISAAEIQRDRPFPIEFPPQPYSSGRIYVFTLAAVDTTPFAHALWRYWMAPTAQTRLQRGEKRLRGQLVFQAGYQEPPGGPPKPAVHLWQGEPRAQAALLQEEVQRLTQKARQVARRHGLRGLWAEALMYIRWQLGKR